MPKRLHGRRILEQGPTAIPWNHEFFIAEKRSFVCGDCNERPRGPRYDVSDPRVEVWEFYSAGWKAPCVCRICRLSIPIYIGDLRF